MSDFNRPPVSRTHYFSGESLLTADFLCEQHYHMQMLALNNSSLHIWGIARGLDVSWQAGSSVARVTVSPGMAIDRLGRQIVLVSSQVLKLEGIAAGSKVYLTIRYHEVYGDFSDESGVPGYKRIVQQPVLEYLRTLQDPGINILLAVITLSSQGGIDAVADGLGTDDRRYVGSRLGVLELVTEGTGIHASTNDVSANGDTAEPTWSGIALKARKESDGLTDYLDVQASRSHFGGLLTTRDNLGIGVDQPQANLQVERISVKGTGTMTTMQSSITLQCPIYPPLQPGDVITPELPLGAQLPQPSYAVIKSANANPLTYDMVQPFKEDMLFPCRYNYTRMTLVRFAAGNVGELFRIQGDGNIGLGVQSAVQSGTSGPAALTITADRKVGIALDTSAAPNATLDINGTLLCRGTVTAQSFEGNGSKLQNLPILSYWTKQNVSSSYSNIYYNSGNIGVQMTDPPASLSVGTGRSFVGSGLVSADAGDSKKSRIIGQQTIFTSQVRVGDSIVLGSLIPQWRQIKTITDDHLLELTEQFPIILQQSAFQYAVAGTVSMPGAARLIVTDDSTSSAAPSSLPGTGTVSSNGVMLTGDSATQFTQQLHPGDWLVIGTFAQGTQDETTKTQWLVEKVVDDQHVLVINPSMLPIPANLSAFMVMPSLIGAFQCNLDDSAKPAPPPAMLMISNGMGLPAAKSNTVAINLGLDEVNPDYALEVNGDVNFSGGSSFANLVADTVTVNDWASIAGAGDDNGTVLAAGPAGKPPRLSVTQTNVVIGQSSGGSLLEVGGDAHATGNLSVDGRLSGQSIFAGPANAPSASFSADGTVSLFGNSVQIINGQFDPGNIPPQTPVTWKTFSGTAPSDGFIVASFGPLFPNKNTPQFAGWMTCDTPSGTYWATGGTFGFSDWNFASLNSLSAPVQKGQSWGLQIKIGASSNCVIYLNIYWVPLGTHGLQQLDSIVQHASTPGDQDAVPFSGNALPSTKR